jgi:CheY-like chemotaxis protein
MSRKTKILVVDDDFDLLEATFIPLKDQGYEITGVRDARMAIRLLSDEGPFDLVITDVFIAGLHSAAQFGGLSLVNAIRAGVTEAGQRGTGSGVPIILWSVIATIVVKRLREAEGVPRVIAITKPTRPRDLLEQVNVLLGGRES